MRFSTRKRFTQLQAALLERHGAADAREAFAVTPSLEQTLHDAIVEDSDFLQRINVFGVKEKSGEKILGGLSGPIVGRTNTATHDRTPRDLSDLNGNQYALAKTESDIAIPYELLDQWAKFPNFSERLQKWVNQRKALDRIMVGWNGTSVAAATDRGANPLGQDVNKGWLQEVRDKAAAQVLSEGATAGQIKFGAAGDFKTLDAAAGDLKQGIAGHLRDAGDLIVIVGGDLLAWDEGKLYANHGGTPSEKQGIQIATQSYGGLPALTNVPYFPANGLLVTSMDNLSIYWQEESNRRALLDNPKRDRVEDYHSRNEGYVVEQLEKIAFIEAANVQFV